MMQQGTSFPTNESNSGEHCMRVHRRPRTTKRPVREEQVRFQASYPADDCGEMLQVSAIARTMK